MVTELEQETEAAPPLALTGQERELLRQMLATALAEVRVEVHRTHSPDFRADVQRREALIRGLLERLEAVAPG